MNIMINDVFQAESLKMQLSERESELAASQQRLAQMEKDLVELSLANENYRFMKVSLLHVSKIIDKSIAGLK